MVNSNWGKIFKIQISLLLIFSLVLGSCSSKSRLSGQKASYTYAEQHSLLEQIGERGVLKVGTTGDFMPFSYQKSTESGAYYGLDIELAKDLAKSLGVDVQFVKTTWPSLLSDLQSNAFDIGMSGITITLERQKNALFSIPLLSSGKAAITRDENVNLYSTLESINSEGVRVIVNPGGTNELFSRENFPKATIVLNEDNLSIFQKIVDGEADIMITDAMETLIQERLHPELEAINADKPFNFFEMGYLLPTDHIFKAYVDQWLNLRLKDGTYQEIYTTELNKIK